MNAIVPNETNPADDPVERGLREWQRLKNMALDATARAEKAEADASYHRGQNAVLLEQKKEDTGLIRLLEGQVAELRAHMSALGVMMLDTMEKMKLGSYRAPSTSQVRPGLDREPRPAIPRNGDHVDAETRRIGQRFGADNRPGEVE